MRLLILMAVSLGLAAAQQPSSLQRKIEALAKSHKGKIGFYGHNLRTGEKVLHGADVPVPTASTIKLLIFVEAFHQIKDGRRSLTDELTMKKEDQVSGSGVLQFLRTPMRLPLEDALVLMMIESDNTATNLAIDHLGRDAINQRAETIGLKNTYLYKKVYRPAEGPQPPDQKKFGLGKTTAAEMGRLMESVVNCDVGDKKLCDRMIAIMKNQSYRNMIPRLIEPEVDASEGGSKIADKVGQIDASRSDVAAIWLPDGSVGVISAYSYENKDTRWTPENDAELLIARMSKAAYDAWATPAKSSARVK